MIVNRSKVDKGATLNSVSWMAEVDGLVGAMLGRWLGVSPRWKNGTPTSSLSKKGTKLTKFIMVACSPMDVSGKFSDYLVEQIFWLEGHIFIHQLT